MNTNRSALGLAGVLAATVLTGGAAVFGLTHRSAPVAAPAPAAVVQQAPAAQQWEEGGD
jgi:hypothetical protein